MLSDIVARAYALRRHSLLTLLMLISFQPLASVWTPIGVGNGLIFIPTPSLSSISVETYYQNTTVTMQLPDLGSSTSVYYQVQQWQNGAFDETAAWQCIDEATVTQNSGVVDAGILNNGIYRIKASTVMVEEQCLVASFEAGDLINSEPAYSQQFFVSDTDLSLSSITQKTISSYDMLASWPTLAVADSYKLGINRNNVWHYLDISAADYDAAFATDSGWTVVDSFNDATGKFTPYTGFGDFTLSVSYCIDGACSLPIASSRLPHSVAPVFEYTASVNAVAGDYALKLNFEADSRTPKFRFHQYVEYGGGPLDYDESMHDVIAPDAQTSYTTTNNGRTIAYERILPVSEPGDYQIYVEGCTTDFNCHQRYPLDMLITVLPETNRLTGGIDPFIPHYDYISGWVSDTDQAPEKVRLYHNGTYIQGTEVSTYTGADANNRYFQIHNLEQAFTAAGINMDQPISIELRALNWPSTTLYQTVQTIHVNQFYNSAPVAVADAVFVSGDAPININVLANDYDAENNTLQLNGYDSYSSAGLPLENYHNNMVYTPDSSLGIDVDTFTYSNRDEYGRSSSITTVSVIYSTVMAVEDEVELQATATTSTKFGRSLPVYSGSVDVLANDYNLQNLPVNVEIVKQPEYGTATVDANNQVTVTLTGTPQGPVCFDYRMVTSVGSASNVVTSCGFSDDVFPTPDQFDIVINSTTNLDIVDNDHYTVRRSILDIQLDTTNTQGSLSIYTNNNNHKMVRYTPPSGYVGGDSFRYQLTGYGDYSGYVTVSLNIGSSTPAAPTGLTAVATSDSSIEVTFNASTYTQAYHLQTYKSSTEISPASIANASWLPVNGSNFQRNYTLTDLTNGFYYYRVKACSNFGSTCSPWAMVSSGVELNNSGTGGGTGGGSGGGTDNSDPGGTLEQPDTESNPDYSWPSAQDEASAAVGVLAGSFRVTESGGASYQVPVKLLSGIGGVTPEVSLQYNSAGGSGALGSGWQLSAGGAISRCRQTYETDNQYQAIALDTTDRFCLNGQRLIAINDGVYGANDTTYKTEINSQQRIKSYGTSGTGPAYFTVEAPDGSISYYGKYLTHNTGTIEASDQTVVTWLLVKVVDNMGRVNTTNNNAVEYVYSHLNNNETILDHISYSGNTVDFSYSTKSDTTLAYSAGMLMAQTQRLDTITVKNHSDQAVSSYHLDYTPVAGMPNNATRLRSIKQCDGTIVGLCKPATTFDWYKPAFQLPKTKLTSLTVDALSGVIPMEVDGDGKLDVAVLDKTGSNSYVIKFLMNDGSGSFETNGAPSYIYFTHDSSANTPKVQPIDVNGDGVSELVVRYKSISNDNYHWKLYTKLGNYYTSETLLSNITSAYFTDITGDGLADLIYRDALSSGQFGSKLRKNIGGAFADVNDEIEMPYPTLPAQVSSNIAAEVSQFTKNADKFDFSPAKTKSVAQYLIQSNFLASKVTDFNGDGLADIVAQMLHFSEIYDANSDCDIEETVTSYHVFKTVQNGSQLSFEYYTQIPGVEWHKDGRPADTLSDQSNTGTRCDIFDEQSTAHKGGQHFFDFNADGMTDIVYQDTSGGAWQLSYSTGAGFTSPIIPSGMTGKARNITFFDADADGDAELIYTIEPDNSTSTEETHTWYMHENEGGSLATRQSFTRGGSFNAKQESAMFLDATGDGEVERLNINYTDNEVNVLQHFQVNRSSRIDKITDGLGNETNISYLPLTHDGVYTRGSDAINLQYANGSPVFDLISPMYVVSEVTSSAPSYNAEGTSYNSNNSVSVLYAYKGLRAQSGGRGLLGFKEVITFDPQSGITSDTTYRQDFPYIGMPTRSRQCLDKGLAGCDGSTRLLSIGLNFYNDEIESEPDTIDNGDILVAYPYRQVSDTYQLNSDSSISFINRTENYTYKSEASAGGYLQIDSTNSIVFGTASSSGTQLSFTTTQNTYGDDVSNWWINRVTATEVTQGKSGQTNIVRNASFVYDSITGLLIEEYIEPNSSDESLYLKTVHTFDDYGNKLTTTQCSLANITSTGCAKNSTNLSEVYRHANSVYDANNRYLTSTGNDLFNDVSTIVTRNKFGRATQIRDIDGVNRYSIYDSFGQAYASKNDAGQFKKITKRFAADKPASWPFIDEPYSIVSQVIEAGKPVAYSYTDQRGLTVATVTQGFADNTWIVQYNRYDKHGQSVKQSIPFYYGDTVYWSSNQYDIMSRPVSSTSADGNTTATITYKGLTTSTTSVSSSSDYATITENSSKTVNRIGETVTVTDNLNNTISYVYDVTGKLNTTTTNGTTTSLTHDDYGRKTQMIDPDKGIWTYQYNALGELIEQTDANGHVTRTYRDSLGRTSYKYIVKKESDGSEVFVDQVTSVYSSHRLVEQYRDNNDYRQCLYYDSLGRNTQTTSIFDDRACPSIAPTSSVALKMYNQSTTFDSIGRVLTHYDASGNGVTNHYQNGYLYKQVEASNSSLLMEIITMDAMGNITRSKDGLNVETSKVYHPANGLIQSLITDSGGIQHITYAFDGVGNMRNRNNINSNINQNFEYDQLNRLTHVKDFMQQTVSYDDNGNILSKSDVRNNATYSYNSSRPHAVTHIGSASYIYDNNGNQTRATDNTGYIRNVDYSYFDKPTAITMGDDTNADYTSFKYDSSNNRYQRIDAITNSDTDTQEVTTTYYIGNVEVSQAPSGTIFVKRYVTNAIQTVGNNGSNSTRYTYKDHLGSLDAVVTAQKHIESKLYFDPWGKRTALSKGQLSAAAQAISLTTLVDSLGVTSRGFTGHESIDHTGIIHMNGRIYDPTLGRFLQADPFVQQPGNTQSYNRYSYVINNPLRYTDPSGYIFKSLLRSIAKIPLLNAAISYGLNFIPGCQGWCSMLYNAAVTYAVTGSFKAAAIGAFTSAITPSNNFFVAAMIGGLASKVQGGNFGHGFWSAGVGNLVAGRINVGSKFGNIIASAIVGGTVSKLTGGKFSNGAQTWAFQSAIKQDWSKSTQGNEDEVTLSTSDADADADAKKVTEKNKAALLKELRKLVDDKKINTKKLFLTADQAALDILDIITSLSKKYGLELGGNIIEVRKDRYSYTMPVIGTEGTVAVQSGSIGYHTHPTGDFVFSNRANNHGGNINGGDSYFVNEYGHSLYLGVLINNAVKIGVCEPAKCASIGFRGTKPTRVLQ